MIELKGLADLQRNIQRLVQELPQIAGDVLEARTHIEVRSREKNTAGLEPLTIERTDVLEVRVAWPYPHEGNEGTYVSQIANEAGRLLGEGLGRGIGIEIEKLGK